MDTAGAERVVPLSIDELDLLLHLVGDELSGKRRHDRVTSKDAERLRQKLLGLRSDWHNRPGPP
jgi:hypothetical protein